MSDQNSQRAAFVKALNQEMPFGKYQGRKLMDLPGHYLAWFHRQGFPDNTLGRQLALVFELDHNGLLAGLRASMSKHATKDTD